MEKKKAVIVGIGAHAVSWKKAITAQGGWELVAVVDSDTEKLSTAGPIWGVAEENCYTSIEECMQFHKDSKIDLAIIVTPIYTHHVLALEAMELGLNVIVEKNLCSTMEQARLLVQAMDAHPTLCTGTGIQTRYFSKNWTLKKYLLEHKAQLGQICSLNFIALYNWGKTRHGWRRWLPDLFLDDMAPHHLDYMRYVSDMDVVQVQGVNFKQPFTNFKGSSTTFAIMALATPENYHNKDKWIYANYRGDWVKKGPIYEKYEVNCAGGDVELYNKEVTATLFDDEEGFKYHQEKVPLSTDVEYNKNNYVDQQLILDEMYKGIDSKGKIQPKSNFRESIKSFSIGVGIKESFATGQAVFLPKYWENLNL